MKVCPGEILFSDVDVYTCYYTSYFPDPDQSWSDFTEQVKAIHIGADQELIREGGLFGVRVRISKRKNKEQKKVEKKSPKY